MFRFQKLMQPIEGEAAYDKGEPAEVKADIAASNTQEAATEDDLGASSVGFASCTRELDNWHEHCVTTARTFGAGVTRGSGCNRGSEQGGRIGGAGRDKDRH